MTVIGALEAVTVLLILQLMELRAKSKIRVLELNLQKHLLQFSILNKRNNVWYC